MHLLILFTSLLLSTLISSEPLVLTDKTWKDMLCGQWMVEFYAPWCPSCQHFTPTWAEFSQAMIPKEIKVAAIDINEYPSLSGRFGIAVLPTIYYVRDGIFRQYNGERSLEGLKNYIEFQEWQRTQPVSSYLAPDSIPMSIIGSIFDISLLVKDAYTILKDQYGWPAWLIYVVLALAVILIGLVLGFSALMLIDYCLTGSSRDDMAYVPDDSRDIEELEDNEDQQPFKPRKVIKSGNSKTSLMASSTPQRPTVTPVNKTRSSPAVRIQDDEELLDDALNDDDDDEDDQSSNDSNASEKSVPSDNDQPINNSNIRRRDRRRRED